MGMDIAIIILENQYCVYNTEGTRVDPGFRYRTLAVNTRKSAFYIPSLTTYFAYRTDVNKYIRQYTRQLHKGPGVVSLVCDFTFCLFDCLCVGLISSLKLD